MSSTASGLPPATGLRARKKLDTWRALRSAGLELIGERGFEAVTVEDIAAAAEVSKRTFFNYFDSKEAIIFDPDPEEPQIWGALAAGQPADEAIWAWLEGFFLAYLETHAAKLAISKRVISASPALAARSLATGSRFHRFVQAWVTERMAAEGHDHFDAVVLVNAAFTILNVAFATWDPDAGPAAFQARLRRGFAVLTSFTAPQPEDTST